MSAKSQKQGLIGVVIPAYNEAPVIGKIVDDIPRTVQINKREFRLKIIVVNDASKDSTAIEVEKRPDIILINHLLNSGAGAATRTGLHYAYKIGCDFVITMDSDGQHSVNDAVKLIKAGVISDDDFIIGSRLMQTSGNMPLSKRVGNLGLSIITFLLLGVYVSDSQSGMKILNRRALESIDYHSNNYAYCSEMIWKAHQAKLKISEVSIQAIYTDYSTSRGQKNITGAFEIIKQLIKRRFLGFINE